MLWCFIVSLCVLTLTKRTESKFTSADYLDSLDFLICGQITQPSAEDCEKLYDHLDRYYDCLQSLLEGLRSKDPYLAEAVANYWALGKPEFTQDYDVEVFRNLENILRLTNREMSLFFDKIEKIKVLWGVFRKECEKVKYYFQPTQYLIGMEEPSDDRKPLYNQSDVDNIDKIREPTDHHCEVLFDNLDKYYDSLENLLERLRQKDTSAGEGIALYWSMGRPKCTADFDVPLFEQLEMSLRKSNLDVKTFYNKLNKVKQLWDEFKEECEKNKEFCEPTTNPF